MSLFSIKVNKYEVFKTSVLPVRTNQELEMFERFTDRARRVVVLAQEEARHIFGHNYIGTEHILLGLILESEGVAAKALEYFGVSLETARTQIKEIQIEEIIGHGSSVLPARLPFTPRAEMVLKLSFREAMQMGHNNVGPEHILLGLIREGTGVAAQMLDKLGVNLGELRERVIMILSGYPGKQTKTPESQPSTPSEATHNLRERVMRAVLDAPRDKLEVAIEILVTTEEES